MSLSLTEQIAKELFEILEHYDPCYDTAIWEELKPKDSVS